MKIRNLVALVLSLIMIVSLAVTFAVAEGDIYTVNNNDYPDRHWALMEPDEYQSYLDAGWTPYTGVLWYHQEDDGLTYIGEPPVVSLDQVQDQLYNNGWKLVVLYNWLHDGPSIGKRTEQSVSVGYWVLDAVQAAEFMATYQVPELFIEAEAVPEYGYNSYWTFDGQLAADPTGEESELTLSFYSFCRDEFQVFDRGYGEKLCLKDGVIQKYSFEDIVAIADSGYGFEDELWLLK